VHRRPLPDLDLRIDELLVERMREILLPDVPHRQIVFASPKRLRLFFKSRLLEGSISAKWRLWAG